MRTPHEHAAVARHRPFQPHRCHESVPTPRSLTRPQRSADEVLPSLPLDLRLPDALCLGPRVESAESPGHPMSASLLLSLKSCDDPALVGGKAAGLGWLLRNGFSFPPGLSVTSAAYHATLRTADLDPARQWAEVHCAPQDSRSPLLEEWRRRVAALTLPRPLQETLHLELTALGLGQAALWAVRSSASAEDEEEATFAGVYRTVLGVSQKAIARLVTLSGLTDHPLPEEDRRKPVLSGHEALELAALAKRVERGLGRPVDIEWALDGSATWLLQARAIPASGAGFRLTERTCVWSRANFKETMPEVPSPLGLAFLQEFMEHNILRHYRELGCTIPPGLRSVRIIQGRPF